MKENHWKETIIARKQIKVFCGLGVLLLLVFINTGCIGTRSFPLYAKPGETVSVAIGDVVDETGPGVDKSNLTITITDSLGADHVIDGNSSGASGKIRSVFRTFPDPLSPAALQYPFSGINFPNAGNGQIGVILDLPTTLASGTAMVKWISPNLPAYYGLDITVWANSSLEVLPGVGVPHVFREKWDDFTGTNALDLSFLEPNPRVKVSVSNTGGATVGGLQVKLLIDMIVNPDLAPSITNGWIFTANVVQENKHYMTNLTWVPTINAQQTVDEVNAMLYALGGTTEDHFEFYLVSFNQSATIDLNGIQGADPVTGVLNTGYYKVCDINGAEIPGAVVTLTALN